MRTSFSRTLRFIVIAVLGGAMALASLALQGCGENTAKQDFVDQFLSIIEENQSHTEIAAAGQEAFQTYYQSGFTDLESAERAADSFRGSNAKDETSLESLQETEKPDTDAGEIVEKLEQGILAMDEGNSIYALELEKAGDQTVEERADIFTATQPAMSKYLDGISAIIESFEKLLDYVKSNNLEGEQEVQSWLDNFTEEKKSLEQYSG